jgi:hypothetical protein
MNYLEEFFSPLSDLCGLCVFARDNLSFGCGCAALRSLRLNSSYLRELRVLRGELLLINGR